MHIAELRVSKFRQKCRKFAELQCKDTKVDTFEAKLVSLIARFMGPTWGPPGADRTQVGPMLAPWTLLSGVFSLESTCHDGIRARDNVNWQFRYQSGSFKWKSQSTKSSPPAVNIKLHGPAIARGIRNIMYACGQHDFQSQIARRTTWSWTNFLKYLQIFWLVIYDERKGNMDAMAVASFSFEHQDFEGFVKPCPRLILWVLDLHINWFIDSSPNNGHQGIPYSRPRQFQLQLSEIGFVSTRMDLFSWIESESSLRIFSTSGRGPLGSNVCFPSAIVRGHLNDGDSADFRTQSERLSYFKAAIPRRTTTHNPSLVTW